MKLFHPDYNGKNLEAVNPHNYSMAEYITKTSPKSWLLKFIFFCTSSSNATVRNLKTSS